MKPYDYASDEYILYSHLHLNQKRNLREIFLRNNLKDFVDVLDNVQILMVFPRYSSGTGPTLGLFTNDKRVSVVKNYHCGVTEREKKTNLNF